MGELVHFGLRVLAFLITTLIVLGFVVMIFGYPRSNSSGGGDD